MTLGDDHPALRVLIVDDNQDAADSLAVLLDLHTRPPAGPISNHRYDVRVVDDGLSGLRTAKEFVPDCVISDIKMPGLHGYALARSIRSEPALAGVKLVALSAFTDAEHTRLATEAGFDYQLAKAHDVKELLEVLGMIEAIKELAEKTKKLAEQNVNLAGQTKDLLQEVKGDVRELKQDLAELKQDVKELKEDREKENRDGPADAASPN